MRVRNIEFMQNVDMAKKKRWYTAKWRIFRGYFWQI